MKAARLHGTGDVRVSDEPVPAVAAGESLIRVKTVGICGSDLHWYSEGGIGTTKLARPLILGHEFAGTVEGGPLDGRRVAVDPAVPCGECPLCAQGRGHLCPDVRFAGHGEQDGALRELVAWPTRRLHPVPDALSFDEAAMLEPLGVAIHAMDLGHLRVGSAVGVVGCGPIGLLVIQSLRASGAGKIVAVEPLSHRRDAAAAMGADMALSPDEALSSPPSGVDVCFDVAGPDLAVEIALHYTRPGGRVVLIGIPPTDETVLRAATVRRKGLTLAWSRRMAEVYPRAIELATRGDVALASVISDRYRLDSAAEAFRVADERRGLKVIVEPG